MKKLDGIEYVYIMVALMIVALGAINAYRISTLFVGRIFEQSYIYETIIYTVPLTLFILYLAVHIKYSKPEYPRAFVAKRLIIPITISLYNIAYLIGLNFESYKNTEDAFEYDFLVPLWGNVLFLSAFMGFNIWLFTRMFRLRKYHLYINIYTGLLVVFCVLMFLGVISDSATKLGMLDWDFG